MVVGLKRKIKTSSFNYLDPSRVKKTNLTFKVLV
jgi:hypothetical protein